MSERQYFDQSEAWRELILSYLLVSRGATDPRRIDEMQEWKRLAVAGWKGYIPEEQREFYIQRYRRIYPGLSESEYLNKLAAYLGGAITRYELGGTAAPAGVPSYITVSFVPPVPGAPDGLTSRRLYYRTLPAGAARTHIPAWRAKGYLRIHNDNTVTPKLASFGDVPEGLQRCSVILGGVRVETDYLVDE